MPTRLFSEPRVQPREIMFPGQSGTYNTLKGSLYFCLNYNDKYQQQEKMQNQETMPHESSKEGNLVNFLDMYQCLKQISGQIFFLDILNLSAPLA